MYLFRWEVDATAALAEWPSESAFDDAARLDTLRAGPGDGLELLRPRATVASLLHLASDDDLRMMRNTGVKFAGRVIWMWGHESRIDALVKKGEPFVKRIHEMDPDIVLQGAIFEIVTTDPDERAAIEKGMADTEERIEGDMDPYKPASQMDTDEIVRASERRGWLETFAESVQSMHRLRLPLRFRSAP